MVYLTTVLGIHSFFRDFIMEMPAITEFLCALMHSVHPSAME